MKPIITTEAEGRKSIVYQYKGRHIVATTHQIEQAKERNQLTQDQVELMYRKAVDALAKAKKGKEKSGEYLIYSKQLGQGIVVDWRKHGDASLDTGDNHLIIITFLPRRKSTAATASTTRIMVESYDGVDSTDISEYIADIFDVTQDMLNESEKTDGASVVRKSFDGYGMIAVFQSGKFWDIDLEMIEVD